MLGTKVKIPHNPLSPTYLNLPQVTLSYLKLPPMTPSPPLVRRSGRINVLSPLLVFGRTMPNLGEDAVERPVTNSTRAKSIAKSCLGIGKSW